MEEALTRLKALTRLMALTRPNQECEFRLCFKFSLLCVLLFYLCSLSYFPLSGPFFRFSLSRTRGVLCWSWAQVFILGVVPFSVDEQHLEFQEAVIGICTLLANFLVASNSDL